MRMGAALLAALVPGPAAAAMIFIGFAAPPLVLVRVGPPTGIQKVTMSTPPANVGDGTPVAGSPANVLVLVAARAPFSAPARTFTLTADSSGPLTLVSGTDTIPFSEISWTASFGDIPSGSFDGSPAQVILGPLTASFLLTDLHTFRYANSAVVPAGTYEGRITYTAAIP